MKTFSLLTIGIGLSIGLSAWSFQANLSLEPSEQPTKKISMPTFFHDKQTGSGTMSPAEIGPLLEHPLYCKDSTGKFRQIIQFTLVYAERGIYADAEGRPFIDVYYISTDSDGGIVAEKDRKLLMERMKMGDTLKIISPMTYYNFKDENTAFYANDINIIIK